MSECLPSIATFSVSSVCVEDASAGRSAPFSNSHSASAHRQDRDMWCPAVHHTTERRRAHLEARNVLFARKKYYVRHAVVPRCRRTRLMLTLRQPNMRVQDEPYRPHALWTAGCSFPHSQPPSHRRRIVKGRLNGITASLLHVTHSGPAPRKLLRECNAWIILGGLESEGAVQTRRPFTGDKGRVSCSSGYAHPASLCHLVSARTGISS